MEIIKTNPYYLSYKEKKCTQRVYRFYNKISIDDIPRIVEVLKDSHIVIESMSLGNREHGSEKYEEYFFELYKFYNAFWQDKLLHYFDVKCLYHYHPVYHDEEIEIWFDYCSDTITTIISGDASNLINDFLEELLLRIERASSCIENARLESAYDLANRRVKFASTISDLEEAVKIFDFLKTYKDSETLAEKYRSKQTVYELANSRMSSATKEKEFEEIAEIFESIGEYRDSKILAKECRGKQDELLSKRLLMKEYITLCYGQYAKTQRREKALEKQIRYKKSLIADLTARRQTFRIFAIKQKRECDQDILAQEEAISALQRNLASIKEENRAVESSVTELIQKLIQLGVASKAWLEICKQWKCVGEGDCIKFGNYRSNPIEWIILNVIDNSYTLEIEVVSKYVIEERSFGGSTWKDCTLRKWLNNGFLNSAFSDDEKSMIKERPVISDAYSNRKHWHDIGDSHLSIPDETTWDKIYLANGWKSKTIHSLLKSHQANTDEWFTLEDNMFVYPPYVNRGQPSERCVETVRVDGSVNKLHSIYGACGVRPLLTISISKLDIVH